MTSASMAELGFPITWCAPLPYQFSAQLEMCIPVSPFPLPQRQAGRTSALACGSTLGFTTCSLPNICSKLLFQEYVTPPNNLKMHLNRGPML